VSATRVGARERVTGAAGGERGVGAPERDN